METLRGLALRDVGAEGPPHWHATRAATRYWVRSQLLQRRPREWITRQLDSMCWQEIFWIRSNPQFGHAVPPSP